MVAITEVADYQAKSPVFFLFFFCYEYGPKRRSQKCHLFTRLFWAQTSSTNESSWDVEDRYRGDIKAQVLRYNCRASRKIVSVLHMSIGGILPYYKFYNQVNLFWTGYFPLLPSVVALILVRTLVKPAKRAKPHGCMSSKIQRKPIDMRIFLSSKIALS